MVVTLQNHSGIPTVLEVSRGGAATHIVRAVQQGAVWRQHNLFAVQQGAITPIRLLCKIVPLGHVRITLDYPPALPATGATHIRTVIGHRCCLENGVGGVRRSCLVHPKHRNVPAPWGSAFRSPKG